MKALLFDLEGTLVEIIYERRPELIAQSRSETREKLLELGIPEHVLGVLIRTTLLRNRALDWAEASMSRRESDRFKAELDAFMKTCEMRSARETRLYPDTLSALGELSSRGVRMGIVTNTSRDAADFILKNLGLKRFFEAVVTRSDTPRLKPDRAMIDVAVARMGAPAGWLVGDTVYDAEAASRAGLRSIIVRRDGVRPSFSHDHFISSLNDVAPIVFKR